MLASLFTDILLQAMYLKLLFPLGETFDFFTAKVQGLPVL
jgi:hypothetical protein